MQHERNMMAKKTRSRSTSAKEPWAVTEIQVAGFKSISDETKLEIRPLTILAGPNSSGKSSMMQPLLLLKQTLEATYDPGPLLLNGPNVKFASSDQLLSRIGHQHPLAAFHVGLRLNTGACFQTTFRQEHKLGFQIEQMKVCANSGESIVWPGMSASEISKTGLTQDLRPPTPEDLPDGLKSSKQGRWGIGRTRCFLQLEWVLEESSSPSHLSRTSLGIRENLADVWKEIISHMIHLPGLRGNPERTYPTSAVGPPYPGTFEKYTASLISRWAEEGDKALDELSKELKFLRLAGGVTAVRSNDVQIELYVGRLPDVLPTRPEDRMNIADVGIGVSQTLPVLVALHVAQPGTLVYIEQPETHLHPRAQYALAQVFALAAKRGVRVVVETHSSMLLLGVQTLVAENSLEPESVKLHWFQRENNGRTVVRSGELDEAGRFGDWPEDFDDVILKAQAHYLDAAEAHLIPE
jgi:hypothetical protein